MPHYKVLNDTKGLHKGEFNQFTSLSMNNVVQNQPEILKRIDAAISQIYQKLKKTDGFVPVADGVYGWLTIDQRGFVLTFAIRSDGSYIPIVECIGAYDDSCADRYWDRVIDCPIIYPHNEICKTHRPQTPYICDMISPLGLTPMILTGWNDWTGDAFRIFASLIFSEFEQGTL